MVRSMTGFAARTGEAEGVSWAWDLRGVNGRGLDLRLRLPDTLPGFEPLVRKALGAAIARGSVSLTLRVNRTSGDEALGLDEEQLSRVLSVLGRITQRAEEAGLLLTPPSAADLLAARGVSTSSGGLESFSEPFIKELLDDLHLLLEEFDGMRVEEGTRLAAVLVGQLQRIEELTLDAGSAADARREATRTALRTALQRVVEDVADVNEDRVAQELVLIAVKQDVTEELDRLNAHVAAARDLLQQPGPVGRKLDFLAQEFNREANTLCSKAQNAGLTAIGLELKAVVDQMREQIQNVE